jgi:hypothetical protein
MTFDYAAPAELFLLKRRGSARMKYRRFPTAAEAIRFAVEGLPSLQTLGAYMRVGDARFNSEEIRRLYGNTEYPAEQSR